MFGANKKLWLITLFSIAVIFLINLVWWVFCGRTEKLLDRQLGWRLESIAKSAIGLQRQARDNFYKSIVAGYAIAAKLSLRAREQAKQALSKARFSEQGEDAVFNRLERAEDLLRQAYEEMPATANGSLETIFDSARRNLAQAWEFYRNG